MGRISCRGSCPGAVAIGDSRWRAHGATRARQVAERGRDTLAGSQHSWLDFVDHAIFGEPAGGRGHAQAGNGLAAEIADRDGHAANAFLVFFHVVGAAALANRFELGAQIGGRGQRMRGMGDRLETGDDRLARGFGNSASMALPMPVQWTGPRLPIAENRRIDCGLSSLSR